jgi:hypothetical protein
MPQYTPPVRDTRFILEHVVGLQNYANLPGFDAATPDVVEAVLEEGGRFVAEVLFPLNQSGDLEGTRTAASPRPPASRKPIANMSRAAGRRWAMRRNMAARACPTSCRSPFRNI